MASRANSGSQFRAENAASAADDIDAGWEDMPESASVARTPVSSLAPVVSAPRPRSSSRALAGAPALEVSAAHATEVVIEVSDDPSEAPDEVARAEDESVEDVRDEELLDAGVPQAVDSPDFRRRQPGRLTLAAFVGSAVAVIVAGVAWSHRPSPAEHPSTVAEPVSERRSPEPVPEPPRPEVAPLPAAPAASEAASTTAVTVTVKAVPSGAVIFRAGRRIGTGVVEVNVERHVKQRLTALLDGYTPSNFTLDGSRDAVTIVLKRAPKPRAEPAEESVAPHDQPSEDTSTAPAPAPAAAAAPTAAPTPTTAPEP